MSEYFSPPNKVLVAECQSAQFLKFNLLKNLLIWKKRGEHFERQKQPQKFNFSNNINVTDCSVLGILKWKTFRNSPLKLPKPLAKLREKLDMFLLKKIAPEN